jgi:hypothetical protein
MLSDTTVAIEGIVHQLQPEEVYLLDRYHHAGIL